MRSRVRRRLPARPTSARDAGDRVYRYLVESVRIDTRTLALFRIAAAVIIITEIIARLRNFHFFYTDEGVVPRELAAERTSDWAFSIYFYAWDPWVVALLFGIQILFAILLLVGYRTRLAIVVSFLFMVSLDHYNPFVTSYADTLLRMLLFWAIFLPLGERWSIDAVHADEAPRDGVASAVTLLAMGQMVYMYTRNGIHKLDGDEWWDGTATPMILGRDDITFLLGEYTHHFTPLLEAGTYLWASMMLGAFLLILAPGRFRYPLLCLFMGGHFLFAVTVRIGMFPYVAMMGLLLFVPSVFYRDVDWLARRVGLDTDAVRDRVGGVHRSLADPLPEFELTPEEFRSYIYTFVITVIVVTIVLVVALGAVETTTTLLNDTDQNQEVERVADVFNIDQPNWRIFAPTPGTTDRYHVFPARTTDGRFVDVYNERNMTWDRPGDELQHQYSTYRERFFMNSIRRSGDNGTLSTLLAEWYCENWEGPDGERLTHVNMWSVWEDVTMETLDDHEARESASGIINKHGCGDNEEITIVTKWEDAQEAEGEEDEREQDG